LLGGSDIGIGPGADPGVMKLDNVEQVFERQQNPVVEQNKIGHMVHLLK
jgi:hypothetical protein